MLISRRPIKDAPPAYDGPRINQMISSTEVRLIDADGKNQGIVPIARALKLAEDAELDLVEIVPTSAPPVCKILDYGKYKYLAQKKANEAKKKQKQIEVKEIKMRPNIDTHDYAVKVRAMQRFFTDGDKVKVTLRFRGREMSHQHLGLQLLERVRVDSDSFAKVESSPRLEGRQMVMVMAPK